MPHVVVVSALGTFAAQLAQDLEQIDLEEVRTQGQALARLGRVTPAVDALVAGPDVEEPLSLAQRVGFIDRHLPVLVIAEPDRVGRLRQDLRVTPYVGEDVRCLSSEEDPPAMARQIADALRRRGRRRAYQSAMTAVRNSLLVPVAPRSRPPDPAQLAELAPFGILALDAHGKVQWANGAAARLLGLPASGAPGRPLSALLGEPARLARLLMAASEVPSTGVFPVAPPGTSIVEVAATRVEGHTSEAGWVVALHGTDGGDRGGPAVAVRPSDAVDPEAAGSALPEAAAAPEGEGALRRVFDTARDALVSIDAAGTIARWNAEAERLFGWSPDEAIGRSLIETIIPPRYAEAHTAAVERFLRTGTTSVQHGRLRLPALHRDDSEIPVELTIWASPSGASWEFHALARHLAEDQPTEGALRRHALHDPLTGLPNRALVRDRLEQALARSARTHRRTAVLFLDLDRFKLVNDSRGHTVGDKVLVAVGERLRAVIRPSDTVARFGGDEFLVVCEGLAQQGQAGAIADRIAVALEAPIVLEEGEFLISASVGIAISTSGDTPDSLLRDADAAMYRAKDRGGGRSTTFDETMRGLAAKRLELEAALRRGLQHDEFFVVYQPIVSLRTGTMVGVEALLRWQHPEWGVVLPGLFIRVAEETGLIAPIGSTVLHRALSEAAPWPPPSPDGSLLTVSVNISPRQLFLPPNLVDVIAETLAVTGMDPARVTLEITESVLMEDIEFSIETLVALKVLGVQLAVDDFGTGYSSLSYLKRFPIDVLKIDRSFVEGLGRAASGSSIVAAVIAMGHALGLAVVAEGVETGAQLDELRAQGCDFAQGYFFARPVSGDEILELHMRETRW